MAKFFLQTFGCQMNKNDSERISGLLVSLGFKPVDQAGKADLIIVNTCSVRESAEHRVYGKLRNWQKLRKKNPKLIVAVTGCMPGRDKDGKLRRRVKGVDLFFAIEELVRLPQWLAELDPELLNVNFEKPDSYLKINPKQTKNYQSFVTIQTGCDNYCTYCVVPSARGREKNRPVKDVLSEISSLSKSGCKEITLLGQVVNNYKASDPENFSKNNPFTKDHFAALLWETDQIKSIKRISFTAADPQYLSDLQIQALALPNQLNYLHLPVQSGDNEILKKMNRKYTREEYIDLIKKIRKVVPNIALGTDIIVGFCGETKERFDNTVDLYKQCQFDISFPAMYSERTGTAAAKSFDDNISYETKKERWFVIHSLMEEITFKKNQKYLNKTITVLVDSYKDGVCSGNSAEMKFVQFLGSKDLVGKIVNIKVNRVETWVLRGILN